MRSLRILTIAAGCLSAALALAAPPGPGQPFADDDPGCVPDTTEHRKCSETLAKAFATLVSGVSRCHDRQARAAFAGSSTDEEACETKVRIRFEARRDGVAAACSAAQLLLAAAEETQLLDPSDARSLDAHNADAYCDVSSGIAIDPTGDDAGWVPASPEALWCARSVAKNAAKLAQAVLRCHAKMAYMFFAGRDFDEEGCEEFDPLNGRGARDQYSARVDKLVARGGCLPCLDGPHQETLAFDTVTAIDGDNDRLYPCP